MESNQELNRITDIIKEYDFDITKCEIKKETKYYYQYKIISDNENLDFTYTNLRMLENDIENNGKHVLEQIDFEITDYKIRITFYVNVYSKLENKEA